MTAAVCNLREWFSLFSPLIPNSPTRPLRSFLSFHFICLIAIRETKRELNKGNEERGTNVKSREPAVRGSCLL